MKTVIIGGGGTVGSTAAFCISRRGIVDEIVLIDAKENMAASHAMDMEQAVAGISHTMVRPGSWTDLYNASLVIVTAGLPERQVVSRNEFLSGNRLIIKEIAQQIKGKCPNALIITASNPVDILNYEMYLQTGGLRSKVIGFAENDSVRFRWAIAKVKGADAQSVSALAIGEHGESIFLFDTVRIHNKPVILTPAEQQEVVSRVSRWFADYQKLDSRRSSGWTSGENIADMVDAITANSDRIFVCSAVLGGEYGYKNVSLGVPVRLGRGGIRHIIELPLNDVQKERFQQSAEHMRNI